MLGVMIAKQLMSGCGDGPTMKMPDGRLRVRAFVVELKNGQQHEVRWKASNGGLWEGFSHSGHDLDALLRRGGVTTLVHAFVPEALEVMRASTRLCDEHLKPIVPGVEHPIFVDCCQECLRIAGLRVGACDGCWNKPPMFHCHNHPEFL